MAGIDVSLLVINWCINPIVLRVEWWFDSKHFHPQTIWSQTVPLTAAACSESDRQRDWFQTAAVRAVIWHSLAGDRDKLFCVPSVSECQFCMGSQNSIGAFLDCLPDWAQGLRHSHCSRWHTQNTFCHCPVAGQSYPLFGSSLTECRYFHILSTFYESVWQILGLKELTGYV